MVRTFTVSLSLALSACSLGLEVPGTAVILCDTDSECPLEWQCNSSGECEETGLVSDANSPPAAAIGAIAPPGALAFQRYVTSVNVPLNISDADDDSVSVSLEVSFDYDPETPNTWHPITVSNESELAAIAATAIGTSVTAIWDARADAQLGLGGMSTTMVDTDGDDTADTEVVAPRTGIHLRATPTDAEGADGPATVSSVIGLGNEPPSLEPAAVAPSVTGALIVAFTLTDSSGDSATVDLQFREGDTDPWRTAALGFGRLDELTTSSDGTDHVVTWNTDAAAHADPAEPQGLGARTTNVELRLRVADEPYPDETHFDAWQPTALEPAIDVLVLNQTPPRLEAVYVKGESSSLVGVVPIVFRLFDDEYDPVDVLIEYSLDQGTSWSPCTQNHAPGNEGSSQLASAPAVGAGGGVEHSFLWDTTADIFAFAGSVRLRAFVADEAALNGPFLLASAAAGALPPASPFLDRTNYFLDDTQGGPTDIFIADLDGDDALDFVLLDDRLEEVAAFLGDTNAGNPTGTFLAPIETGLAPITNTRDMAGGLFDGDSRPDLAVVGTDAGGTGHLLLLSSDGDGTFTATDTVLARAANSVAAADVNDDAVTDAILLDQDRSGITVLLGVGNGTFVEASTSPLAASGFANAIAAGDVDGDSFADIVYVTSFSGHLQVRWGAGDGSFSDVHSFGDNGISGRALEIVDLDADGVADIALVSDQLNQVVAYRGAGGRDFAAPVFAGTGNAPRALGTGDFDGDGRPDLVTANDDSANASVLITRGSGARLSFTSAVNFTAEQGPADVAAADLNADGVMDFIVANGTRWGASVFLGNATPPSPSFAAEAAFNVGAFPTNIAIGDLDADGVLDLAVANDNDESMTLLRGVGANGVPTASYRLETLGTEFRYGVHDVDLVDLNNDGAVDLVAAIRGSAEILVALGGSDTGGHPSGAFTTLLAFDAEVDARDLALADFNEDGVLDVVTVFDGDFSDGFADAAYSVLLGAVDGTGQPTLTAVGAVVIGPALQPNDVDARDFDQDGHADILLAFENGGTGGTISLLRGNGDGTFGARADTALGPIPNAVTAVDLTRDGVLDLVLTNSSSVSFLRGGGAPGRGDGSFAPLFSCPRSVYVGDGIAADFDGDGDLDVATTSELDDPMDVLIASGGLSSCGVSFPSALGLLGDRSHTGIATADLNGDAILDFAVTTNLNSEAVLVGGRREQFRDSWNLPLGSANVVGASTRPAELDRHGVPVDAAISRRRWVGGDGGVGVSTPAAVTNDFADSLRQLGELPVGYYPLTDAWRVDGARRLRRVHDPAIAGDESRRGETRLQVLERFGPATGEGLQRAGLDLSPTGVINQRGIIIDLPILGVRTDGEIGTGKVIVIIRETDWLRADEACLTDLTAVDPVCASAIDASELLPRALDGDGALTRDIILPRHTHHTVALDAGNDLNAGSGRRFVVELANSPRRVRLLTDELGSVQAFVAQP